MGWSWGGLQPVERLTFTPISCWTPSRYLATKKSWSRPVIQSSGWCLDMSWCRCLAGRCLTPVTRKSVKREIRNLMKSWHSWSSMPSKSVESVAVKILCQIGVFDVPRNRIQKGDPETEILLPSRIWKHIPFRNGIFGDIITIELQEPQKQ